MTSIVLDNPTVNAIMSGGNLTLATSVNASFSTDIFGGATADIGFNAALGPALWWFELDCTNLVSFSADGGGLGLTTNATLPDFHEGNIGSNGVVLFGDGGVVVNGTLVNFVTSPRGQPGVMVVFDVTTLHRCWIKVTELGGWDNTGTGPGADNPCTGVGGYDISSFDGDPAGIVPFFFVGRTGNSITVNFGESAPVRTLPVCGSVKPMSPAPTPPPPGTRLLLQNARQPAWTQTFTAADFGPPQHVTLNATESRDVVAGRIGQTVGMTLTTTESLDVVAASMAVAAVPLAIDDSELVYVPAEYGFRVPADPSSPFVIPFEDTVIVVPLLDI